RFGNNAIHFDRIRPGDLVWRTHDPDLDRVVKPSLEPSRPVARQPVRVHVTAAEGAPLVAEWSTRKKSVRVESPILERAQNRGLSPELLRDQFGRLGNTPYELAELTVQMEGAPFASASMLNQLRRQAIDLLQAPESLPRVAASIPSYRRITHLVRAALPPQFHVLVRTHEQLDAAIEIRPASITLDYLDLYGLRPSVERVKTSGIEIRVATPRVLKPGEGRILNFIKNLDCTILVRSTGMLDALGGHRLIGDFSLNAANSLSTDS